MFKKAFTLAETLLVMAIIGIVATATIPNLMDSYKEDRDVAKLRGVYHDLEVAYAKAVAEYGPYENWGTDKQKVLMKYLKATSCGNATSTSCYPSSISGNASSYYKYELENGVGISLTTSLDNIYVALNGAKGKKTIGKDVFKFAYSSSNQVYPYGKGSDKNSSNGKYSGGNQENATNWVITNGNMDYLRCMDQLNWTNQTSCP